MNKPSLNLVASALLLACAGTAFGAPMTKSDYKAEQERIGVKYNSDKQACDQQAGNARDICMVQADGQEKISRSELEWNYEPTDKHANDLRVAKADSAYAVSKERCDDFAGNAKDVCRKEAENAHVSALADAKVAVKIAEARATAHAKNSEARADADSDKRDAAYALARQKCEALAGDSKVTCLADAKARNQP